MYRWWHRSCAHGAEVDDGARVLGRRTLLCERRPLAVVPQEHTGRGGGGGDHYLLPATAGARDPCKRESCELGFFSDEFC